MGRYIVKRLVLMVPTLFLILLINFVIVQFVPSGPLEYKLAQISDGGQLQMLGVSAHQAHALSDEMLEVLKTYYGFDKPADERFWLMITQYATGEFGDSLFKGQSVASLIAQKLPVSLLLGLLTSLCIYAIAIPLGVYKAVYDGTWRDKLSSIILALLYAMPMFVLALVLLVLFAGGSFWQLFPLQGLTSPEAEWLPWWKKGLDIAHHLVLPVLASSLGGIASICYLTKFSVSHELAKPYVTYAYAKGFGRYQVLYGQVLKNSALVLMAGLHALLVAVVSGNFLIEIIFGIDGMGLLAYEAILQKDYPVMFAVVFLVSGVTLLAQLMADVAYGWLNPMIDFDGV